MIHDKNFVPACVSVLTYKSKIDRMSRFNVNFFFLKDTYTQTADPSKVPLTLVTAAQSDKINNKKHRNTGCFSVY